MPRADRSAVAMQPAGGRAGKALIVQLRAAANLAAPRLFCASPACPRFGGRHAPETRAGLLLSGWPIAGSAGPRVQVLPLADARCRTSSAVRGREVESRLNPASRAQLASCTAQLTRLNTDKADESALPLPPGRAAYTQGCQQPPADTSQGLSDANTASSGWSKSGRAEHRREGKRQRTREQQRCARPATSRRQSRCRCRHQSGRAACWSARASRRAAWGSR